jgi:hypothetical protein
MKVYLQNDEVYDLDENSKAQRVWTRGEWRRCVRFLIV